ncbi:MAG: tRNA (adenosine(37)-N6)-threonylcarbamoyltransferase complex transferase subunit TsaD [Candidatus Shapirobacteria bacterium]|nr:tRNA (adenosine(37)-N6)-threonylcarbamoyltransferase complex transferase subunit TsaD [Candidatus Shapirobacteria bacterium]
MIILGIETSCDETSVAIVENGHQVLSVATASSEALHQKIGGIIPESAAREQLVGIIPVLEEALLLFQPQTDPRQTLEKIDCLAITHGPGLIGSLLVGIETAKTLSMATGKPLIPVNHLEAHIFANWLEKKPDQFPKMPALALIASGGHTELVLVKKKGKKYQFSFLGGTRDDASGECFDKCARVLDLGYPGGPAIAQSAQEVPEKLINKAPFSLPRPMIDQDVLDFSFSGLKTAVINQAQKLQQKNLLNKEMKNFFAWEIQEAISDCLVIKTIQASKRYPIRSLLLGGGVTANRVLREKFQKKAKELKLDLFIPKVSFCTDNGIIIGAAGYFNYQPLPWEKVIAQPSLRF